MARDIEEVREQFKKDVSKHELTVISDDGGFNRHLHFGRPDSNTYYFGLVTWRGYLCIYGDMGTTVFSRTDDMFKFFRIAKNDFNYHEDLPVNPGYWHEKMQAIAKYEGDKKFSKEMFTEALQEEHKNLVEYENLTKDEADSLWEEIEEDILYWLDDYTETEMVRKVMDWRSNDGYSFDEFYEHSFQEYTWHFLWLLHAIVWGIKQYDEYQFNKNSNLLTSEPAARQG